MLRTGRNGRDGVLSHFHSSLLARPTLSCNQYYLEATKRACPNAWRIGVEMPVLERMEKRLRELDPVSETIPPLK